MLKSLPDLPDYENTRRVSELIIAPFERDLDALVDDYGILNAWEYCNKEGVSISEEQLKNIDYATWSNLFVLFEPKDFPEKQRKPKG